MNDFINILKERRSIYQIGKNIPIQENELIETINNVVEQLPSAFHSQSTRVVVLLHEQHEKLWDIVKQELKKIVPLEQFASTNDKINSFANGYGTILFFDDTNTTNKFASDFPLYKDNFMTWAQQSNGIAQFAIWTVLSQLRVGASLQHYNPLIDHEVKKAFGIPEKYMLIAQMPFGEILAKADEKTSMPIEEMVFVKK